MSARIDPSDRCDEHRTCDVVADRDSFARSAVFVGCARDCAVELPTTIHAIERLARVFDHYAVVMVENDSKDDTKRVLAEWRIANPRVHIINLDGLGQIKLSRTGRMARARNAFLDWVKSRSSSEFRFMVVFDADGLLSDTSSNEALGAAVDFLNSSVDHMAAFANSIPVYYDIWTLRHDEWCPADCFFEFETHRSALGDRIAIHRFVNDRQVPIASSSPPIEVQSAFGGLGIYKTESLVNACYSAEAETGMDACEHVALNREVRKVGRMFILPKLLVKAPIVHTITGSNPTRWLTLSANGRTSKILAPACDVPGAYLDTAPAVISRIALVLRVFEQMRGRGYFLDFEGGIGATAALCRLSGVQSEILAYEQSSFLLRHALESQQMFPELFKDVEFAWGCTTLKSSMYENKWMTSPILDISKIEYSDGILFVRMRLNDAIILSVNQLNAIMNLEPAFCLSIANQNLNARGDLLLLCEKICSFWSECIVFDDHGCCAFLGGIKALIAHMRTMDFGISERNNSNIILFGAWHSDVYAGLQSAL